MGMFDSLIIKCLFCKEEIEEQTKSGPCDLEVYDFDDPDLPVWVMDTFNNTEVECYHCNRSFVIRYDFEVIVKSRKLEPVDNLDMLELEVQKREEKGETDE